MIFVQVEVRKYMEYKFSNRRTNPIVEVKIENHITQRVTRFRVLHWMRILCWMSRHSREDSIRNEHIRKEFGIVTIVEKMVELRPWVIWTCVEETGRSLHKESRLNEGRGRPRKTIDETNMKNLENNVLSVNMIYDRAL
ncbi:hypothetical protein Lal_00024057 [Lupinus albus]|nr:hypothetical protein Lal_00024057 [Lupinus albus]